MKSFKSVILAIASMTTLLAAAEPPAKLTNFFDVNKEVRGEIVKVDMPGEFMEYRTLLAKAEAKDPEWYKKHLEKAGTETLLLPYDAKLGFSKADHDKYSKLYDQRKFKRVEGGEVSLMLTENGDGEWAINVFAKRKGVTTPFSALSYIAKDDSFKSMSGTLVKIDDIKSPKNSVYGEWNGHEWRYFNDGSIVKTKENVALGRTGDKRYGILVHSLQEVSSRGSLLADNLIIIRFVPNKVKK